MSLRKVEEHLEVLKRSVQPKPGEDPEDVNRLWKVIFQEVGKEREKKIFAIRQKEKLRRKAKN